MLKLAEYSQRSAELREKTQKAFTDAGLDFSIRESKTGAIRLVFAGQYSAGKSSILKMLTGRTDIAIGAIRIPMNRISGRGFCSVCCRA